MKRCKLPKLGILLLPILTLITSTSALALGNDAIRLSGFTTIAATQSNTDYRTIRGATQSTSIESDSLVGIQIDSTINQQTSFTIQIIARGTNPFIYSDKDQFEPQIEWAFAKVQLSAHSSIKVGRLRNPPLMLAEEHDVSYSYPWVAPPAEVYARIPDTRFEGINYEYNRFVGNWAMRFLAYASTNTQIDNSHIEKRGGIRIHFNNDTHFAWLNLNVSELSVNFSDIIKFPDFLPINACENKDLGKIYACLTRFKDLSNNNELTAKDFKNIALDFSTLKVGIQHISLAYKYDTEQLLILTELSKNQTESTSSIASSYAAYITTGIKLGKWMPHLTLAHAENDQDFDEVVKDYEDSTGFNPLLAVLDDANYDGSVSSNEKGSAERALVQKRSSATLGLRWDYAKNSALKFENQYITGFHGSNGFFDEAPDKNDKHVWIHRLALTLVF